MYEYDEAAEEFILRVATVTDQTSRNSARHPVRKGEGALGRTAVSRSPSRFPTSRPRGLRKPAAGRPLESGIRAILAVPLVREDRLIGGSP